MPFVDSNTKTFIAAATINKNRFVTVGAANAVTQSALAATPIGVALNDAASGEPVAVRLLNAGGTVEVETEAAVADGAVVYARATGLVDDSSASSAVAVGIALQAASGAGAIIEILPTL